MSPLFDDTDDDVTLPRRGDEHGSQAGRSARELDCSPADREFTLNTGVVLALFFSLALLCAAFFGFGYSIGHKSAAVPAPVVTGDSAPVGAPVISTTSSNKPSPGTVAVPGYVPSAASPPSRPAPAVASPTPRVTASTAADAGTKPAPVIRTPAPPTAVPAMTAAPGSGTIFVQVAAVSHQEDADILLSSLRRRGYTVQTRTDANDHLIHVQIGPFPTRKDADTMRQKLLSDGYNAILK